MADLNSQVTDAIDEVEDALRAGAAGSAVDADEERRRRLERIRCRPQLPPDYLAPEDPLSDSGYERNGVSGQGFLAAGSPPAASHGRSAAIARTIAEGREVGRQRAETIMNGVKAASAATGVAIGSAFLFGAFQVAMFVGLAGAFVPAVAVTGALAAGVGSAVLCRRIYGYGAVAVVAARDTGTNISTLRAVATGASQVARSVSGVTVSWYSKVVAWFRAVWMDLLCCLACFWVGVGFYVFVRWIARRATLVVIKEGQHKYEPSKYVKWAESFCLLAAASTGVVGIVREVSVLFTTVNHISGGAMFVREEIRKLGEDAVTRASVAEAAAAVPDSIGGAPPLLAGEGSPLAKGRETGAKAVIANVLWAMMAKWYYFAAVVGGLAVVAAADRVRKYCDDETRKATLEEGRKKAVQEPYDEDSYWRERTEELKEEEDDWRAFRRVKPGHDEEHAGRASKRERHRQADDAHYGKYGNEGATVDEPGEAAKLLEVEGRLKAVTDELAAVKAASAAALTEALAKYREESRKFEQERSAMRTQAELAALQAERAKLDADRALLEKKAAKLKEKKASDVATETNKEGAPDKFLPCLAKGADRKKHHAHWLREAKRCTMCESKQAVEGAVKGRFSFTVPKTVSVSGVMQGWGVAIGQHLVTAAHLVCKDKSRDVAGDVDVSLGSAGAVVKAAQWHVHPELDIAWCPKPSLAGLTSYAVATDDEVVKAIAAREQVTMWAGAVAHPGAIVSGRGAGRVTYDSASKVGDSGGAVFNGQGRVVGIHVGGFSGEMLNEFHYPAIPGK